MHFNIFGVNGGGIHGTTSLKMAQVTEILKISWKRWHLGGALKNGYVLTNVVKEAEDILHRNNSNSAEAKVHSKIWRMERNWVGERGSGLEPSDPGTALNALTGGWKFTFWNVSNQGQPPELGNTSQGHCSLKHALRFLFPRWISFHLSPGHLASDKAYSSEK